MIKKIPTSIKKGKVPTIEEVISELKREKGMREFLYPKWLKSRKIKTKDEARHKLNCIIRALEIAEAEQKRLKGEQTELFT